MNNETEHISLEINTIDNVHEVFMYLDRTALSILINDLQRLNEPGDHTHYMSNDWGGVSLSTQLHDGKNTSAHHLQICIIDKEHT